MKITIPLLFLCALLCSCQKELTFKEQTFTHKSSLPCEKLCPEIIVKIPIAENKTIMADSINAKLFSEVKSILDLSEKPSVASDYQTLVENFIASYETLQKRFPEDTFGWEGKVTGSVLYTSANMLNIKVDHYTFTGGAHGYQGSQSILFDPQTGKSISTKQLFKKIAEFRTYAETLFRKKYKIPAHENINATGLLFENDLFHLPLNVFFTKNGLQLFYNTYEAAAYVEGPKEVIIPYKDANQYLNFPQ